jgi:hypothetical protein
VFIQQLLTIKTSCDVSKVSNTKRLSLGELRHIGPGGVSGQTNMIYLI